MKRLVLAVLFASSCLASGCKKKPEPTHTGPSLVPTAMASSISGAAAADAKQAAGLTWVDPPSFKRSARVSPMRKATYTIAHASGDTEDAELGVFYFGPGQGGGVDANVDRWVKQFSDVPADKVKRADRSANGLVQHTVEIESGSYNANMMGRGPAQNKANYALLGAIVEGPSGAYFFKLTGPAATVAAARAEFYQLLDSVHVF